MFVESWALYIYLAAAVLAAVIGMLFGVRVRKLIGRSCFVVFVSMLTIVHVIAARNGSMPDILGVISIVAILLWIGVSWPICGIKNQVLRFFALFLRGLLFGLMTLCTLLFTVMMTYGLLGGWEP